MTQTSSTSSVEFVPVGLTSGQLIDYVQKHPQACCCRTWLSRKCCKSPIHGDMWEVNGIENGEGFHSTIRAKNRAEALEIGKETCMAYGGECTSVKRLKN